MRTALMVVYIIVCIVITIIVLSQEGKPASLTNSISGGAYDNSYWSKNKKGSKEEVLKKITGVLGFLLLPLHFYLIPSYSSQ